MKSIGEFFSKIQNRHAKELFWRKVAADAVNRLMKTDIKSENVSFKSDKIHIKGLSQTAKSQFFIKKESIITEIKKDFQTQFITQNVADLVCV